MTHNLFYKLDENKNVVPATMKEANDMIGNHDKSIVKQETINGYFISIVFLAIDHNYLFEGAPIVFETMICDESTEIWKDYQKRYATWDEAVKGHERAVQWVKDGCKEDD